MRLEHLRYQILLISDWVFAMDTSGYTTMRFDVSERVLTVFLDDPAERDDPGAAWHEELARLFADLQRERDARAVVLTGSGATFFTGISDPAGALQAQRAAGVGVIEEGGQVARRLIHGLLDVNIPIVAALNGDTASLGATIALLCDAVFLADSARIWDPHVQLGVAAGDGAAVVWPLVVGPVLAKRYLLTGDALSADAAAQLGVATHVCPADTVVDEATAFAQRLAQSAPLAIRHTKTTVNQVIKQAIAGPFEQGLAHELITFTSDDMVEAVTARRDGRAPRFHGR